MPEFETSQSPIRDIDADVIVVGYFSDQETSFSTEISEITEDFVANLMNNGDFDAKSNEVVVLPYPNGLKANRLVLAGLGEAREYSAAAARQAAGSAAKTIASRQMEHLVLCFPDSFLADAVSGVATGCQGQDILRAEKKLFPFEKVTVISSETEAVQEGATVGDAINTARFLVNQPANILYPETFADNIERLGEEVGFEVEIWDKERLVKEECRTLLAVSEGSDKPPRLAIMRYLGGGKDDPTLALVGKGVTFDSGGYSLKPSDSMFDMKCDMGGAATVVGAMKAIAGLKLPVNVVGYCGLVENLISGSAFKLGDVIRSRNGKTVEIHNTDAEGRLVLADVLDVAQKEGVDHIVDFATLTGACLVALGTECAGLFTNNEDWNQQLEAAAARAGEECWELPMFKGFSEQIKSNVADIKNMGSGRWGGAITAAKFLEEFVGEKPWVHVDIAGPAWSDNAKKWIDAGGSGCFVRTLVELCRDYGG